MTLPSPTYGLLCLQSSLFTLGSDSLHKVALPPPPTPALAQNVSNSILHLNRSGENAAVIPKVWVGPEIVCLSPSRTHLALSVRV